VKHFARIGALLTVVAFGAWPSRADLIALDSSFGPGTLIEDTDTHSEWLKLTVTVDRSFDDISSQLGAGGEFAGFRYGNVIEVAQLFKDGGLPSIIPSDTDPWGDQVDFSQSLSDIAAVTGLINLFGPTPPLDAVDFAPAAYGIVGSRGLTGLGPDEIDIAGLEIQTDAACAVVNCAVAFPVLSGRGDGLDTTFPFAAVSWSAVYLLPFRSPAEWC